MRATLVLAAFALLLFACSEGSADKSVSPSDSKAGTGPDAEVAYHVIGMKKAASGAT